MLVDRARSRVPVADAAIAPLPCAWDPDVVPIFSDIEMPETNALELLEELRQRLPDVRIYLVTAYDGQAYTQRAAELGAHGYLTKPLDFTALRQIVCASSGSMPQ